jgi:hypothetical protein
VSATSLPTTLTASTPQNTPSHSAIHNLLHQFANQVFTVTDSTYGAVGNGVADDTAAIQAAIDAAYDANGGQVYLPVGLYRITDTLILKYGVSLIGSHPIPFNEGFLPATSTAIPWSAIILGNGANCTMIENDRVNGPARLPAEPTPLLWQRSTIANIQLYGNASQQSGTSYGIHCDHMWGLTITGCSIEFTRNHSIFLDSVNAVQILNSHIISGGGMAAGQSCIFTADMTDSVIAMNFCGGSTGSVCRIGNADSTKNLIANNFFFNSTANVGLYIGISTHNQIIGNRCDQNFSHGIQIDTDALYSQVVGNSCNENGFSNVAAGIAGISVAAVHCVVTGNACTELPNATGSANQDYGIAVAANCEDTIVDSNIVTGNDTAGVFVSSTNNANVRVRGNSGFITEARGTGTIASGATTAVVTHGLSATPALSGISIVFGEQGTNDYGRWSVGTITATQFTLTVASDPGASSLDFAWQAVVL